MKRKNEAYWSESQQRWQINVQKDGRRKTFVASQKNNQKTNRKGKIEAEKKADRWLESGVFNENTRVDTLVEEYKKTLTKTVSKSTAKTYFTYIDNYILSPLGHKKIRNVTEHDFQDVIDTAFHEKNLAKSTLSVIRSRINAFLFFCRRKNVTNLHIEKLTIPRGARTIRRSVLDHDDIRKLFSSDKTLYHNKERKDPLIYAYRFLAATGLRPGEMIGLEEADVVGAVCSIKRSINTDNDVTSGKNENALRTFELSPLAVEVVQQQREYKKERGIRSRYIFVYNDSEPIKEKTLHKQLRKYCEHNNFDRVVFPYEMRHTFNSVNDELPDRLRKLIMGHSESMDTNAVYSHEMQGDMSKIADYVQRAFSEILDEKV